MTRPDVPLHGDTILDVSAPLAALGPAQNGQTRPTVLLVDDDPLMLRAMARFLESHCDVATAGDGREALAAAHTTRPDVIVSDVQMPHMDGRRLVQQIKEDPELRHVPIILISGAPGDAATELEAGADDYLRKPFASEELLARIRSAMRLHALVDRYFSLFDGVPVGIFRADAGGAVLEANRALIEMLGYESRHAIGGVSIWSLFAEGDDRLRARDSLRRTGRLESLHAPLRRADGVAMWAEITVRAERNEHGDIALLEGTIDDISERKAAEIALRQNEERFRALFDGSPIAMWEEDYSRVAGWLDGLRAGGIVDVRAHLEARPDAVREAACLIDVRAVNRAAIELVGASSEADLLGPLAGELITDTTIASMIEQFVAVSEGKDELEVELIGSKLAGQVIDCMLHWAVPSVGGRRDLSRVVVAIVDISERKRIERETRAHAEQLSALLEVAHRITSSLDLDLILQRVADETARVLDADRSILQLVDADRCELTAAVGHGYSAEELADHRFDEFMSGIGGWVLEHGESTHSADIAQDARLTGRALERVHAAGDAEIVTAPLLVGDRVIGTLTAVNGAASATSFTPETLGFIEMLASEAAISIQNARLYANLQESHHRIEETLSELHETQSKLLQAQKLEAIGQLAAGIAHEINTPIQYVGDNTRFTAEAFGELATLYAAASSLVESAQACDAHDEAVAAFESAAADADVPFLVDEVPAAIEQTLDGVARVAEIVRALKDFAHPGEKEKAPVDLNRAIENTLAVARNEWKYVADVRTNLDPALPQVRALAGPLNQVLLILIVNAAQAIGDDVGDGAAGKGTITVETSSVGDWVEVRIGDDGPGVPAGIQNKIFDPFFTTKEVGKGSGQGLSIAHAVVTEQHGGEIAFTTELGVGTTFVVRLPTNGEIAP